MSRKTKKVSLKEIAEIEKVSIASVSMALSGKPGVSEKVVARIKKTADELGYIPSKRERSSGKCLDSIAILQPIDEFSMHSWNIFTRIIKQIEHHLFSKDFFPVIIPVNSIIPTEIMFRKIIELNLKAVISIHAIDEPLFSDLTERDIPVVIVNNSSLEGAYTSVLVDDFQGAYNAAVELVNSGHKKILYVDYPRTDVPNILMDRRMGVQKASLEYAAGGHEFHMLNVNYDSDSIREGLKILDKVSISALVAHDDYLGSSLFMVLKELGYRIPDDISMISTGGGVLDYSIASTPQLSGYELDVDLIGKIAGEETIRLIESEKKEIRVLRTKQIYRNRMSISRSSDTEHSPVR